MFNDADLIGIPLRLTVGQRRLAGGEVEVKLRGEKESSTVVVQKAADLVAQKIGEGISS
jgi:prolyl-tRNA synthetase